LYEKKKPQMRYSAGAEPNGLTLMHRNTGRNFFLELLTIFKEHVHQGGLGVVHQGGLALNAALG
jgi:hypothetical protein